MASISQTRRGPTRSLAALIAALVLAFASFVAPVAAGSNADAAHACQQRGYLTLTRSDGSPFKNAGECTSYAAQGGVIPGLGAACTAPANSGCIVLDNVTIREASITPPTVTYLSTTSYTLSGAFLFTPTCQIGSTGCDPATTPSTYTVTITGSGSFSASTGTSGFWTASYTSPDPYSFTDASSGSTTCAAAAIRTVTARLALTWSTGSGGAFVQVRLDSSEAGPLKNFVLGNFYASGLPSGFFHTGDVTRVALIC